MAPESAPISIARRNSLISLISRVLNSRTNTPRLGN